MREINFRGKRIDNGEWVEGQTIVVIHQDDNDLIFMPQHGEDAKADPMEGNDRALTSIYGNYYQILPQTVGQYTGLTDKNAKRIYEGDILMSCGEMLLVVFSDTRAGFVAVDKNNVVYPFLKQAVVIGNIHDDPILWEVK